MADPEFSLAMEAMFEGMRQDRRMTHSSVALATAAILDNELESALKAAMGPQSKKLYKDLFETKRLAGRPGLEPG